MGDPNRASGWISSVVGRGLSPFTGLWSRPAPPAPIAHRSTTVPVSNGHSPRAANTGTTRLGPGSPRAAETASRSFEMQADCDELADAESTRLGNGSATTVNPTSSRFLNPAVFASTTADNLTSNRWGKRPVTGEFATPMDISNGEDVLHGRNRLVDSAVRERFFSGGGEAKRARPESAASELRFLERPSSSLLLDRSHLHRSFGRFSSPQGEMDGSSPASSLRGRISRPPSACSSAMSSQTRRVLEQLEKTASPVKEAHRLPAVRSWDMDRWMNSPSARENPHVVGARAGAAPPRVSIGAPSRAQIFSSHLANLANKPYWRRPSQNRLPPVDSVPSSSTTTMPSPSSHVDSSSTHSMQSRHQPVLKNCEGRRAGNVFSARFSEDADDGGLHDTSTLSCVVAGSADLLRAPPRDFLGISTSLSSPVSHFSFSKPVPRLTPSVSSSESGSSQSVAQIVATIGKDDKQSRESRFEDAQMDVSKKAAASDGENSSSLSPISSKSSGSPQSPLLNTAPATTTTVTSMEVESDAMKDASSSKNVPNKTWTCSECFVANSGEKCVCCGATRSSPSASVVAKKATWSCNSCFISNASEKEQCIACGASRNPPTVPVASTASSSSTASVFGDRAFNATTPSASSTQNAKTQQDWSCTTCFVQNHADKSACASCQAPRPGNKYKPVQFGLSNIFASPLTGSGNGVDTSMTKKSVSFSENPVSSMKVITPLPTTEPTAIFSFGVKPMTTQATSIVTTVSTAESALQPPTTSSIFAFGTSTSTPAVTTAPIVATQSSIFAPIAASATTTNLFAPSTAGLSVPVSTTSSTAISTPVTTVQSGPVTTTSQPVFGFAPPSSLTTTSTSTAIPPSIFTSPSKPVFAFGTSSTMSNGPSTTTTTASDDAPPAKQPFGGFAAAAAVPGSSTAAPQAAFVFGSKNSGGGLFGGAGPSLSFAQTPPRASLPTSNDASGSAAVSSTTGAMPSLFGASGMTSSSLFPAFPTSSTATKSTPAAVTTGPVFNFNPAGAASATPFTFAPAASSSVPSLPTTFTFGSGNTTGPVDPANSIFQFGASGDAANPFMPTTGNASTSARRVLTANRRRPMSRR